MNPEIKAAWLEALRSGRYKQGRGSLRENDEYCCLGVLCDIVPKAEWNGDEVCYGPEHEYGILPTTLATELGIDEDPRVIIDEEETSLSAVNDCGSYDFTQIADLIEEQL